MVSTGGADAYALTPVPLSRSQILPGFWGRRLEVNRTVTVPHCLDQVEASGRVRNFEHVAAGRLGIFEGDYAFNDSDVYKSLEAAAYVLASGPDPRLEARADAMIETVARAQDEDGYLFTQRMLMAPDKRFTDMNSHEMYCGGHLIEAAVAYAEATGKTHLLGVARRLADHYLATFGPGRRHWVDGHEEIGLALAKLSEHTGDPAYRRFAAWHLEERGHGHGRGRVWEMPGFGAAYSQDRVPVAELTEAEGHAVRATYLYSAMADAAAAGLGAGYGVTLEGLWSGVVGRKMYVTGGIGAAGEIEGFGADFDLPNETAYAETCAAIGMILWSERMHRRRGEARFADLVELELYNGMLAGVSLSGDRFFYANPLASAGERHRAPWFGCACCPPNLARTIARLPAMIYSESADTLFVNQFVESRVDARVGTQSIGLRQRTGLPWRGDIELLVEAGGLVDASLALRLPAWARSFVLDRNGAPVQASVVNGYVRLSGPFRVGDRVTLRLPLPVERLRADRRVKANRGRVAIRRGPVVYCAEEVDQRLPWSALAWPVGESARAAWRDDFLDGVVTIGAVGPEGERTRLVPYYAWDNRSPGGMAVWLDDGRPAGRGRHEREVVR